MNRIKEAIGAGKKVMNLAKKISRARDAEEKQEACWEFLMYLIEKYREFFWELKDGYYMMRLDREPEKVCVAIEKTVDYKGRVIGYSLFVEKTDDWIAYLHCERDAATGDLLVYEKKNQGKKWQNLWPAKFGSRITDLYSRVEHRRRFA